MGIGANIKNQRVKAGLTQKELSEQLNVTFQAVSRWENDYVEPSYDTIKQMAKLFKCTTDDLLGMNEVEPSEGEETKEISDINQEENVDQPNAENLNEGQSENNQMAESAPQTVIIKEVSAPQVIGICDNCKKIVHEGEQFVKFNQVHRQTVRSGRHRRINETSVPVFLCEECNERRENEIRINNEKLAKDRREKIKKRRIRSFIWPSIFMTIGIIVAIILFINGQNLAGGITLGASIGLRPFFGCLFLGDNSVGDIWLTIASKTITWPGVIFSLDFGGLIFLVTVKLLFAILSILLTLTLMVIATGIGGVAALFVYPFALKKNLEYKVDLNNTYF